MTDAIPQLTRDDLKGMTPDQVNKARQEGRLDVVLGRREAEVSEPASDSALGLPADLLAEMSPEALDILIAGYREERAAELARERGSIDQGARTGPTRPSQLSRGDLEGMTPEAISKALQEGRLDTLLDRKR